ncbi:MAG: LPS assembly protein LptD [Thermomonas sp.]|nr:LPS assembly protein LptD [Thermomonas sp.]
MPSVFKAFSVLLNCQGLPLPSTSGKLSPRFPVFGSPVRLALRLLPLSLAITASLSALAAEDKPHNWALCPIEETVPAFADAFQAPQGLNVHPADQPTDIEGDDLGGTDANPIFKGNVTMRRGAQFMGADQLTFDKEKGRYTAEGSVRYQASGLRLLASHAEGDQQADSHSMRDLKYQLLERRGNGQASRLEMVGDIGHLYGATYSTCPTQDRHWELSANQIELNTDTGMAIARGAKLKFGKVPVLYLPWFMFPTNDQRRTGLLFPSISNSSRNGFDWKQPIYLNLAPNYDATLSPRIMTNRGISLDAQFRYLLENGDGVLDTSWMPNDKLRDRSRSALHFAAQHGLTSHWQARANLNWISDPRYYEDFTNSIDGLAQYNAYSAVGVYGRGSHWSAGISADHWQLADYTLSDAILPYDRLPRAYLSWDSKLVGQLQAGIDAEAVRFHHPVYAAGSRLDLKPWLSLPLEGDAWFIRPTLAWRQTGYSLEHALGQTLGTNSPSRGTSIFSFDSGLVFDRETRIKNKDYLQTIEPRLFYLNVPYTDQTDMPVFDTQPMTFSWGQLFRDNRYSGADRQADANQLTLAVSTRTIRQSDGRERFSASAGQIRYFRESKVHLPNEPIIERGRSAWVADTSYAPTDRWTFGASYQWDPQFKRADLASVRARYLLPEDGVFNLSYRYRRQQLEQVDMSFLYPLNPSWSLVAREYYSIRDRKTLEGIAGVQWDSCCVAVRLVGRRYVHNRAGDIGNSIMLEIELKGLGSAGQDTKRALRRSILGYNRDDLYLVPPQTASGQPPSSDTTSNRP